MDVKVCMFLGFGVGGKPGDACSESKYLHFCGKTRVEKDLPEGVEDPDFKCDGTAEVKAEECSVWRGPFGIASLVCPSCNKLWPTKHRNLLHQSLECFARSWSEIPPSDPDYALYQSNMSGEDLAKGVKALGGDNIADLRDLVERETEYFNQLAREKEYRRRMKPQRDLGPLRYSDRILQAVVSKVMSNPARRAHFWSEVGHELGYDIDRVYEMREKIKECVKWVCFLGSKLWCGMWSLLP